MSIRCVPGIWSPSSPGLGRLLDAIVSGDEPEVCNILHQHNNLPLNQRDKYGRYPLQYAVSKRNLNIARLLLDNGADVAQASYATYHRNNVMYSCYETAMIMAVRLGHHEMVALLCAYKADPDTRTQLNLPAVHVNAAPILDRTALHFACEEQDVEMVKLLVEHKADVNLMDRSLEAPLHKVVRCSMSGCEKQARIVTLLLNNGASIDALSKMDCSPLYVAVFYGCVNKTRLLLQYGADINLVCKRENSYGAPLHVAAGKELTEMVQLLISNGALLDIKNSIGLTALQLDITQFMKSVTAQTLVYHGADVNGVDGYNQTLMAVAIKDLRLDCEMLARLLVYAGYDLHKDHWLRPAEEQPPGTVRVPIPQGRVRELCNWLREMQTNPLPLYAVCRVAIRAYVKASVTRGRSIVGVIERLPLPASIRGFLLLTDLITEHINTGDGAKSCIKI